MMELTLPLTEDEHAQLTSVASARSLPPTELALHVLRRELAKGTPAHGAFRQSNAERAAGRNLRQLWLARHVAEHGYPETPADVQILADKLEVGPRTIYRDLGIIRVMHQGQPLEEPPVEPTS